MTSPSPDEQRASSQGRVAIALVALSLGLCWAVAFAGPSAVSHELAGGGLLPPYSLDQRPSAWLVVASLWVATIVAAAGTWIGLRALRAGWSPRPALLLGAAAIATVAFAVVPPVNSDDVYSYAAYGRMAATGHDPYTTAPDDLPDDPVAAEVTSPWREEPTVYGPLATAEQALVMRVAGSSVRGGVLGIAALGALAFLGVAALLDRYADDDAGRRRAALCWALNPLMLFNVVGGAHLDALGVLAMLLAIGLFARRRWGAAGAALGAAIGVKLTGGVAAIGLAWSLRGQPKKLSALVAAGAVVVVPLYLLVGGVPALGPARAASRFVSHASWWRPLAVRLDDAFGFTTSRRITSTLALLAFLALAWLLVRALPPAGGEIPRAARFALAPTIAWLLTATYVLPWYAAWAWPLLALVLASHWDDVLLAWTAVLTIAYVPGRDVTLPTDLAAVSRGARAGLGPVVLAALLIAAIMVAARAARSAEWSAERSA